MQTDVFALRVIPEKLTPISQIPEDTPESLANLIKSTFDLNPEKRPTFDKIFSCL